jgi:hypothetical protein
MSERVSHEVLKVELDGLKNDVEELKAAQQKLLLELSKYKGMWGGIILVFSAISAAIMLFSDYIKIKISG